ncbi:hypothetical protein IYX23_04130 [Methylocystis sp. L43]|uniref:hypothetical protein n=1 Tax=unclassified Methylocystis TaxID=2625913 RepID=UPI0018C1F999|nr:MULTISPECIES: hypothetical protein [unclassified Methylocystis]MBG0796882.1 hypothetical protein [Methylocystis sp. L43]MBG0806169.1 hypothetical protein [Methylocystis sp. H15]
MIFGAVSTCDRRPAEAALTLVAIFHLKGLLSRFAAPKGIAAVIFPTLEIARAIVEGFKDANANEN